MDLRNLSSNIGDDNKFESEQPKEINHPSHPNHLLYFHEYDENGDDYSSVFCDLCGSFSYTSSYQCHARDCYFKLHLACSSLMPSIKHEQHEHLLTLIESCGEERACQKCRYVSYSLHARCLQCEINYHVQCGRQGLPGTTIYKLHDHPLFLTYNKDERKVCDACLKELNPNKYHPLYVRGKEFPIYNCKECDYSCHARCVISEIKLDKREKLDHSIHEHVLFLCDEGDKEEGSCCVCGNIVCATDETTSFTYGCSKCSFYIHKSCIDKLPALEIAHEFHAKHSLTLNWKKDGYLCKGCDTIMSGFNYRCSKCMFSIDLDCASKEPSIRDKGHDHLLTYFNKLPENQRCIHNCGFSSANAGFLRCVQCNFNVHLLCSLLPRDIKFKGHLHSLALKDFHIEDDFGEYYCDHCEDPRDPKECAYHCAEGCPYVVEFNCVIDEVLRSLKRGEVGVMKVDRHAADEYYYRTVDKGLYLHDVYKSFSEEELELRCLKTTTQTDKENLHLSFSLFNSDKIDRARRKWLDSPLLTVDLKSEVVKIGKYIITKNLENVFSEIHDKYSDIGDKCSLSEGSKTIVLIQFIQVIQEMTETRIVHTSKKVLLSWLFRMLLVQQAGFAVDFVFKHINKVAAFRSGIKEDLASFPEHRGYYRDIEVTTGKLEFQKAKLVRIKTVEKERIDLKFDASSKEARLRLLNNMDISFERASKGLL